MTSKQAHTNYKNGEEDLDMKETKLGKASPVGTPKRESALVNTVKNHWDEAKVITKNAVEFIETAALLIVTGFAIYGSLTYSLRTEYKYAVLFSGVVVGLIAMNLLRKFLARR